MNKKGEEYINSVQEKLKKSGLKYVRPENFESLLIERGMRCGREARDFELYLIDNYTMSDDLKMIAEASLIEDFLNNHEL